MTRTHSDRHERALSVFDQFMHGARAIAQGVRPSAVPPPIVETAASASPGHAVASPEAPFQPSSVTAVPAIDHGLSKVAEKGPTSRGDVSTGEPPRQTAEPEDLDVFLAEMRVLVKYGHDRQVADLLERAVQRHSANVQAIFRLAECEFSTVSPNDGLERLFRLASRALDEGDLMLARRIHDRVKRDAPGDLRVMALASRIR